MNNKQKERIEKLESILSEMKKEYEEESEREYRASVHKSFKKGDWIQKDKEFGKVGWVENNGINIKEEDGYVGIDLLSGRRGFMVCRRDDWSLMSEEDVNYLTNTHKIKLTGEEICGLLYLLRCNNWSQVTEKIPEKLKSVGNFSLFKEKSE